MLHPLTICLILVAFAIGSVPTGFLVARARGVDIRQVGSGNVGATNVKRTLGSKAGGLTLLGDCLKGAIAASLPFALMTTDSLALAPFTGLAALIGHCFSPFLKFNGGKGVATGLGAFLVIAPLPALAAVIIFAATVKLLHYVSVASMAATAALALLISLNFGGDYHRSASFAAWGATAIVFLRHRPNIARLRAGVENRVG